MKFAEFFQEDNGGFSATRLIVVVGVLSIILVWMIISIVKMEFQAFTTTHVAMVGTLGTLKVVSKTTEAKDV